MQTNTEHQMRAILSQARALFEAKTLDYGTAWRILRLPSITDQIYIKAGRIRTLQEKGVQLVAEGQAEEFIAIINYALMALVQMALPADAPLELAPAQALAFYDAQVEETLALQQRKNHDYAEAWRQMRVSSITDIILMKLLRIKQIEDAAGPLRASEGVEGGYRDMVNYACFALILLG